MRDVNLQPAGNTGTVVGLTTLARKSQDSEASPMRPIAQLMNAGLLACNPNAFMDEVRVKTVVLRDAGNRGARLSSLSEYLGLEGFGKGSAVWLYEKIRLRG